MLSLSMLEEGSLYFYAIHDSLYFLLFKELKLLVTSIRRKRILFIFIGSIWSPTFNGACENFLLFPHLDGLVHCCSYVAGVCFANTWSPRLRCWPHDFFASSALHLDLCSAASSFLCTSLCFLFVALLVLSECACVLQD